tara:strand:- start:572 stop:709 length:138 start_codon:yes stop_codon:yes gene_type:complete
VVGIVQVLAVIPIRRRKTIGYVAGERSKNNKDLAAQEIYNHITWL